MSRLKELRLHGFKSFAEPTRFVFAPGVNAVIGPNGSGKSNMADAVRWVMGEQSNRSLRTRRTDDVIFAGSEQRKPQGMAEAILTLDNTDGWLSIDFAEVTIGRRAYRSGEGEYLINGARARLRDVVELLGSGRLGANELVVVGQGTVDAALSLRPEERRQLFEEAAGVKGLQVRKNEAGVRLSRAQDNLARVADLLGELRPQVRRLALQAEHQQQHESLGQRARALVAEWHRRRERSGRSALGEARRAAATAEAALGEYRAAQAAGRDALAAAESRYWEAEAAARHAAQAREVTREALIRAEARAESLAARRGDLEAQAARVQLERERVDAELAGMSDGAVTPVAPALAAATAAEERWRAAVDDLAAADADLVGAEEALAERRRQETDQIAAAARRAEDEARDAARRERAEAERADAVQALDVARREARAANERRQGAAAALVEARSRLDAAARDRDAAQEAADLTRQRAAEVGERLGLLRAEQAALRDRAEGGDRLGRMMVDAGWTALLDALEAPDDAWPAIEAVVGGDLEHALLWRDADVARLIDGARGAARILDTHQVDASARDAALAAVGASRTLADWVGASAPGVLGRAVLAPGLDALLAGWRRLPAGWCAVTVDGDLADARGLLVVRGRAEAPGPLAVRERARRRELDAAVRSAERDEATAAGAAHAAAERLRSVRDEHLAARDANDAADAAARRASSAAAEAEGAVNRAERELGRLEAELAAGPPGGGTGATEAGDAPSQELDALERLAAAARRRREEAAAARDAARDAWTAARGEAEQAESAGTGQLQTRSILEARIAQLRGDQPRMQEELAAARAAEVRALATLERAREDDAAAADMRATGEREREARRTELLELERGSAGVAGRLAELERAAQATAVEASRREEALVSLARERELALEGLPGRDGTEAAGGETVVELDDEALEVELRRVRRTLAQIGSVNPFAVEEHRELAARLEGLSSQDADLRAAIRSTEELIARLDAQITQQFDAAFRAIGERFDEYCRLLFAGGSASLQMADEGDGDAPGGIEIVVRPPGKRLQRLAMLSGGERALTGVALLFAMLSVNPVPFCILDEVDAALDEANIGRFAEALRRLAESIDFVVITHNRATIEVADTIYGVTMTDAAVSRLLSLRLADLPAEATA